MLLLIPYLWRFPNILYRAFELSSPRFINLFSIIDFTYCPFTIISCHKYCLINRLSRMRQDVFIYERFLLRFIISKKLMVICIQSIHKVSVPIFFNTTKSLTTFIICVSKCSLRITLC